MVGADQACFKRDRVLSMPGGTVHEVDESQSNELLEMVRGDLLDVHLTENATTGFRWRIEGAGSPVVELEHDRTVPGSNARPGGGGSRRLRFRAAAAGRTRIELVYARRVPADAQPAKKFVLRVRVLP